MNCLLWFSLVKKKNILTEGDSERKEEEGRVVREGILVGWWMGGGESRPGLLA
jgi:hypothetical protein